MESGFVLVTGITGYLGSTVVKYVLDAGYKVRATMRNPKDEKKVEVLGKAYGESFDRIELVAMDLNDRESIIKATKDVDYILHVASPVGFVGPDDFFIKPAVDGTRAVLEGAKLHNVKGVIVTSSVATIHDDGSAHKEIFDEADYNQVKKKMPAYVKSKILAEQCINEFMEGERPNFTICTLHPALIIGPGVLNESTSSIKAIKDIMIGKYPAVPKFYFGMIDVRDLADAHVKALQSDIHKERIIITEGVHKLKDITQVLHDEFGSQGYKITNKEMSKCPMTLVALFKKDIAALMPMWNIKYEFNNKKSIDGLGVKYRSFKETVTESGQWLIDIGEVKKKK